MKDFCLRLAEACASFDGRGHALEIGHDFQERVLPTLLARFNKEGRGATGPMPWLAALVCCSVFDLALHDAHGQILGQPVYDTYNAHLLNRDRGGLLTPAAGAGVSLLG